MTFWDQGDSKGPTWIHLNLKNSKSITFTVRVGFFTFWAILAHSAPPTFSHLLLMSSPHQCFDSQRINEIEAVYTNTAAQEQEKTENSARKRHVPEMKMKNKE